MSTPIHFVVGTGRCGSSLLHEIMCRHESIDFISNLQDRSGRLGKAGTDLNNRLFRRLPPTATTKGRARFAPSEAYEALARDVSPLLVDPYRDLVASDATPGLAKRLEKFFTAHDAGVDGRLFVHKFTGWPRARLLAEVFPEARFVQVVRDPRDVVSSWLRMPWWRGHLGPSGWHFGPLSDAQQDEWQASGESFAVLAAIAWQMLIDAGLECKAELGDAWLDVKYEDVCGSPESTLAAVLEHLGTESTATFREQLGRYELNQSGPGREWPEIGDGLALVENACQRGMAEFAYERSGT